MNLASTLDNQQTHSIRSHNLIESFDQYADKITILSLDCFDTLLWRKAVYPIDVFYDLQNRPAFKKLGFNAMLRVQAEKLAREINFAKTKQFEINLEQIYRAYYPDLTQEEVLSLIEDEITAEKNACYAFQPILNLMQHAHAKNKKIIIVSDIYFTQNQLQNLLKTILPESIFKLIDKIYCSSDYGYSKSQGLFQFVLQDCEAFSQHILHIGDNLIADYGAASKAKMHALHLQHYDECVDDVLRMQYIAASIFDTSIRQNKGMANPYKGLLAAQNISAEQSEKIIGFAAIGPIMYAFAHYILNEFTQLKNAGKKPKLLFLMRDGYLPALACEKVQGETIGYRVRISRFSAYAASFRTQEDIDRYVGSVVNSGRFEEICKQLLLPDAMIQSILLACKIAAKPAFEFLQQVRSPDVLNAILTASAHYRTRLINYVKKQTQVQSGETLVFVDLGYIGTTQRILEPIFRDLGIELIGRYLISSRTPGWEKSRAGLLDPDHCDDRATHSLIAYISLLEQVCSEREKSVIDYTENGDPIFDTSKIGEAQYKKLDAIQTECLQFIAEATAFFAAMQKPPSQEEFRQTALAALARFLFLATQSEIKYLQSFQFELNLGTGDLLKLFDEKAGLEGLHRRGLFFMEKKNIKTLRTNYPAELRATGLELVLTLMAHYRFGLDINLKDMSLRREHVKLIVVSGQQSIQAEVHAVATYEGYFAMVIPVSFTAMQIGLVFGANYKWLQLESAELIKTSALCTEHEAEYSHDIRPNLMFDQMVNRGGGLYECLSQTGLLVYQAPTLDDAHAVRIVFRPILSQTDFIKSATQQRGTLESLTN